MPKTTIASLVQDWEDALPSNGYSLVKGKKAESVRTLTSALSMTLSALEEQMPWAARKAQTANLLLQFDDGALKAQWESAQDTYDLKGLIGSSLGLAGHLSGSVDVLPGATPQKHPDDLLVEIVATALTSGKDVLPGFSVFNMQPGKSATLVWQP